MSRETKFSGTNADREIFIFPVQLTTCRTGNLIRLIHTLAVFVTIHIHAAFIGHLKLDNYDAINDQHQLIRDAVHSNPVAGMVSHKVDSINGGYAKCN